MVDLCFDFKEGRIDGVFPKVSGSDGAAPGGYMFGLCAVEGDIIDEIRCEWSALLLDEVAR